MSAGAVRVALGGRTHHAIGLMSGTSHDGISAALVKIDERVTPPVEMLKFVTRPYPARFRQRLLEAASGGRVGADELSTLNFELGRRLGDAACAVARGASMRLDELSFVGSHGHTFAHLPARRLGRGKTASTLQLGEPAVVAEMTHLPVVSDFRAMDVALGGEGAPLAPLAHVWLFGDPKVGRVIQNIGGIGNATYIPPLGLGRGRERATCRVIAFDTGPGVMLVDALATRLSSGRMRMDRDGRMAARGRVDEKLLAKLMRNPYFARKPPKSTGRDEFGAAYLRRIDAIVRDRPISGSDLIATVTALTARSIAAACRQLMAAGRVDQLIATGGGAHNRTLMGMIAAELPDVDVMTADAAGVDGDALEAVAFAILAYQTLRARPGNRPSVTGAKAPAILGKITLPP